MSSAIAVVLLTACGEAAVEAPKTMSKVNSSEANSRKTPGYNASKNVYFGDLHIHIKNSLDAYIFNVRTTPADVYRFASGENLKHPSGFDMTLAGPPLDFVAATDHGAYMGVLPAVDNPESPLSDHVLAKKMFQSTDQLSIIRNFQTIG